MVPLKEKLVENIFSDQLNQLKSQIEKYNNEGNLDGLFSKFILGDHLSLELVPLRKIKSDFRTQISLGNFLEISRLGYSLSIGKYSEEEAKALTELFLVGLKKLKAREVFTPERVSFAFMPREYIGIVLGTKFLQDNKQKEYLNWLTNILNKRLSDPQVSSLHKKLLELIGVLLSEKAHRLNYDVTVHLPYFEACFLYWSIKRGYFSINDLSIMRNLQLKILQCLLESNAINEEWLNSVIYYAAKLSWMDSIDEVVTSKEHVVQLLSNFESAMKRWPNKPNHKWPIKDEKDIQSILWAILRSIFEDITDEDPSPKFGHRFSIIDFRIPSLNLLIEAKFIKKQEEFAKIENEIKIDRDDHLATKPDDKIIVFIYDNSASVEEHQTTVQALEKLEGIHRVLIVSKPSHVSSVLIKFDKR